MVSGGVEVGDHTFLGVNSTLVSDVAVGEDCWIGPGVMVTSDLAANSLVGPAKSILRDQGARERFLPAP